MGCKIRRLWKRHRRRWKRRLRRCRGRKNRHTRITRRVTFRMRRESEKAFQDWLREVKISDDSQLVFERMYVRTTKTSRRSPPILLDDNESELVEAFRLAKETNGIPDDLSEQTFRQVLAQVRAQAGVRSRGGGEAAAASSSGRRMSSSSDKQSSGYFIFVYALGEVAGKLQCWALSVRITRSATAVGRATEWRAAQAVARFLVEAKRSMLTSPLTRDLMAGQIGMEEEWLQEDERIQRIVADLREELESYRLTLEEGQWRELEERCSEAVTNVDRECLAALLRSAPSWRHYGRALERLRTRLPQKDRDDEEE